MSKRRKKAGSDKGISRNPSAPPASKTEEQASGSYREEKLTIQRKGPIPDAAELDHYEKILPGAANRILEMAEGQAEHRWEMEKASLEAGVQDAEADRLEAKRGQIFGFSAVMTGFVVAGILGWKGQGVAAGVIGAGGLASLASAFILGRWKKAGKESS